MAKARIVVGDQNSAELDALKRSYNSLLVVLENIAQEASTAVTTPVQAFTAMFVALDTGRDSSAAPHVGTQRMVFGIRSQPNVPQRFPVDDVARLVEMIPSDPY